MQWAGQMLLLGCHLLSATGRMAGEDAVEQKDLGSLICHQEIRLGPSSQHRGGSGIINWDVLEEQGALLPPPLLFPGCGSAQRAGPGSRSGGWSVRGAVVCSAVRSALSSLAVVVRLLPDPPPGETGLPVLLQDRGDEEEVDGAV